MAFRHFKSKTGKVLCNPKLNAFTIHKFSFPVILYTCAYTKLFRFWFCLVDPHSLIIYYYSHSLATAHQQQMGFIGQEGTFFIQRVEKKLAGFIFTCIQIIKDILSVSGLNFQIVIQGFEI